MGDLAGRARKDGRERETGRFPTKSMRTLESRGKEQGYQTLTSSPKDEGLSWGKRIKRSG